jgi:hypothetical protein
MTTVVETKEENSKTEEELEREWEEERLEAKRKEERKLVELGITQTDKEPEAPKELEEQGYIEQVERKAERDLPAVPQDDQGQPLITQADEEEVEPIVLPMTKEEFEKGIHEELWTNLRWLTEWCLYVIKKYGGRVFFRG